MSEITRRDVLQRVAAAIMAAAAIDTLDAHETHLAAHQAAAAAGGQYVPKALSAKEFATLERLTDLIIPADDKPGAIQAGVAPGDLRHWLSSVPRRGTRRCATPAR